MRRKKNTELLSDLNGIFKALANPSRLQIFNMLQNGKEMSVTEIYIKLQADQPAVSHHLSIMKNSGILETRREAQSIFYFINNRNLKTVISYLEGVID